MHLAMKWSTFLLSGFMIFAIASTTAQAQFREAHKPEETDSVQESSIDQLLAPMPQTLATSKFSSGNFSSNNDLVQFSNTAKFFLRAGADLIRGGTDNVPLYSFENAWKYSGPTVKYPETASEHELFLERYQRYNPDN